MMNLYSESFEEEGLDLNLLYNFEESAEENFSTGSKYLIIEVNKGKMKFGFDDEELNPKFTKILNNIEQITEHGAFVDVIFIDPYETSIHGCVVRNFKNYTDFFNCQERVFFECLLVKHKYFKGEFYWSKNQILKETGIKRSSTETIVKRFIELGILTSTVKTSMSENNPQQITYYTVVIEEIRKKLPLINANYSAELLEAFDRLYYI